MRSWLWAAAKDLPQLGLVDALTVLAARKDPARRSPFCGAMAPALSSRRSLTGRSRRPHSRHRASRRYRGSAIRRHRRPCGRWPKERL